MRYALAGAPAPLAVADDTYDTLPPQERGGLPTAEDLAAALGPLLAAGPRAPGEDEPLAVTCVDLPRTPAGRTAEGA